MALYYKRALDLTLSQDANHTEVLTQRDNFSVTDTFDASQATTVRLTNQNNTAVNLGSVVTGALLYMESDSAVDVFINGSATAMKLRPDTGKKAVLLSDNGSVTALTLTNQTTGTASVYVLVAGATS
jgi:hypothetical protein